MNLTRVIVGDEIVRCPSSRCNTTIVQTTLADLEELQGRLVNFRAVTGTLGKVVDDGSVMRLGPDSPLQLNGVAASNLQGRTTWSGIEMADDVRISVGGRCNIAIAEVLGITPASDGWWLAGILEGWIVSLVVGAGGDDSLDISMSRDGSRKRANEGEGLRKRHDEVVGRTVLVRC